MEKSVVFISSTFEDLKPFRQAARDAALKADFFPVMMEYFEAGSNPPLQTCLDKVRPCNVVVVIVAHRYGWIPNDPKNSDKKSITWLECEAAIAEGKQVIPFLVDEKTPWPEDLKECYRLTSAMNKGRAPQKLFMEVQERIQLLQKFKQWLGKEFTVHFFNSMEHLGQDVLHALVKWQVKPAERPVQSESKTLTVPVAYTSWLADSLATVELLVTVPKEGFGAPRLSSLYVPAPTDPWEKQKEKQESSGERQKPKLLLDRFAEQSLYVSGIAGCGKSTFCRWIAWLVTQGYMPEQETFSVKYSVVEKFPAAFLGKLPLLVPLREFWPFLSHSPGQDEVSLQELETALQDWSQAKLSRITPDHVMQFIRTGRAVLLFDGVDEVPESYGEGIYLYYPRRMLVHGLAQAVRIWSKAGNKLLLTSRPYGLKAGDVEKLQLPQAEIIDLPAPLQELYIRRWFGALQYDVAMADAMLGHLQEREELAPLSGNPVLLMAMCSLFPQGGRLPQDKSELYKMTIDRLLYNRYRTDTEVRNNHERLAVIAHSMHTGRWLSEAERQTPQAEVTYSEIEKVLSEYLRADLFQEAGLKSVHDVREELLSRSGLLVAKGQNKASFYHLTFQEYLTGRRMVQESCEDLLEKVQHYGGTPEWRQTLSFAFGSALQDTLSSARAAEIIRRLVLGASVKQLDHLLVLADFIEILYLKEGKSLAGAIIEPFRVLCGQAIEEQVDLLKRFDMARVLGIVGDPRLILDLRHPPHGYVEIPADTYLIGDDKRPFELKNSFWLGKYPVTNGQFRLFWQEDGYKNNEWWSTEGREWRDREQVTEPRYWRHGRWNGDNFPVVGVSWYEADAFCKWAGGRLPDKREWEAAARGPNGLEFPWGNKWNKEKCNNLDTGLRRTSPVGLFPSGRSKDSGLEDMSGNVWEWTDSWYDRNKKSRVVRGGSWYDLYGSILRSAFRNYRFPEFRNYFVGFRCLQDSR